MDHKKVADQVIDAIGGEKNINSLTFCATRLRFTLNSVEQADLKKAKSIEGVIDAVNRSGMVQVIIGPEVESVYREVVKSYTISSEDNSSNAKNEKWFTKVLDFISGVFTPIIPVLIGAGMIKALLALLKLTSVLTPESQTYMVFNFIGDAGFYFLPIFISVSTAQKLKTNMYMAAFVGAILLHPDFVAMRIEGAPVSLFGLPIALVNYGASVMPAILSIIFMSYVDKFFKKILPNTIKYFVHPLVTILISSVATLFILGPLGAYFGQILAASAGFLYDKCPWLVSTFIGAFNPVLVMTGMQWSITAVLFQSYSSFGYEGILGPGSFVSNISQGAASLAVALRTKDKGLRQIATSAGITALMGITEPAMYGVTLKLKKPLIAVMIGGAVGGLYSGIMGVVRYTQASPGLASFAIFIGENPMNIVHALISVAIGFAVTFILTLMFGVTEASMEEVKAKHEASIPNHEKDTPVEVFVIQPAEGEVVDLAEVNDPAFSSGMMGNGFAVKPAKGLIVAPFDGKATMIFDTGHAISLENSDGKEVLIHIGIETVNLNGRFFHPLIKQDDTVVKGQPLIEFDLEEIKKAGYDTVTPMIITNDSAAKLVLEKK